MDQEIRNKLRNVVTQCRKLLEWLEGHGSRVVRRPGRVEAVEVTWAAPKGDFRSFSAR